MSPTDHGTPCGARAPARGVHSFTAFGPGPYAGRGAAGRTVGLREQWPPSAPDQATATATTPGQEGRRSLLVHLNEVRQEGQSDEAHKVNLYLATKSDLPPEFLQSNVRSEYTASGKLLPSRPELDRLVRQFV